jgi:hypothetical protein
LIVWFVFKKLKWIIEGIENSRGFGKIVLGQDLPLASRTIFMKIDVWLVVMAKAGEEPYSHIMADK